MSKHFLKQENADHTIQVEMGWDRPMQMFYCVIWQFKDEEQDTLSTWEEPLYSNLNEPPKPLEYYVDVCKSHGLIIPDQMIDAILTDRKYNVVNKIQRWDKSGSPILEAEPELDIPF